MRPPDDLPGIRSVPLISVRDLTKRFPGVVANDSVSLDLLPGEVHALLGENGAGKTTLISMLYGLLQPDGGSIAMDGRRVAIKNPRHAMDLGIGLVAQHFNLARRHTVAENLAVGLRGTPFWRPTRALNKRAAELTERYGLAVRMSAQVASLSPGERQRVEILKAVMQGARLLILDEPTSVLTPQEADALLKVVSDMRRDGRGILFISDKLGEVLSVADRITVLRGGKVVGRRARGAADASELARLMVGAPTATPQRLGIPPEGEPVLRVAGV
ncbi:MAG TPA: ATP-binding cassette domain-containing protein, partial [Trueperaceae bacterium]|nr:ATP-binding cassette domain-containing protein [Trueperaceae bacterium]